MPTEKIKNKGQARLFENKILEALTKTPHPAVIYGMYLPLIGFLLFYGANNLGFSVLNVFLVFFSGLIFWSFFEYVAHRWLFHFAGSSAFARKLAYLFHGNHHEFPRDRHRLLMPPLPSLLFSGAIFGLMFLLLADFAYLFFPGFIFGYLLYGGIHYAIHAMAPPFKWLKPLWRNHHLHHYKNEELGFGVSNLFWDRIFGTSFDLKREKDDKDKVKNLMFDR